MAPRKLKRAAKSFAQNVSKAPKSYEAHCSNATEFNTPRRYILPSDRAPTESADVTRSLDAAPTLADRFYSLPMELRLHIFSSLVCQPVKWNILHEEGCDRETPKFVYWHTVNGQSVPTLYRCVRCSDRGAAFRPIWKSFKAPRHAWKNPWRSQYAPEVMNEFMGSDCWDEEFRPRPCPQPVTVTIKKGALRCLCARRKNLDVMLVCRRWREEAGRLFYSSNVFAFEDAATFVDFVDSLPDHWRALVSKVSILSHRSDGPDTTASAQVRVDHMLSSFQSSTALTQVWAAFRRLPALSYLELDGLFLSHAKIVKSLLRLGLRNLRSVRFTLRTVMDRKPEQDEVTSPYVYSEYAYPRLLVGGLAEEVCGAIKGRRKLWLKRTGSIEEAAERQKEVLEKLLLQERTFTRASIVIASGAGSSQAIHYDEDAEEWGRLWDRYGSAEHPVYANLPTFVPPVAEAAATASPKIEEEPPEVVALRLLVELTPFD